MNKKKIGYFGGTFDPPHLGHLIIAREAYYQLDLDLLRWVLTPDPPHKLNRKITPVDLRMNMLELAIDGDSGFEISTIDIDRKAPHYAADTVELIKKEEPDDELVYIIGEDSLRDLTDWRDVERFLSFVDLLAVAPRPDVATDLAELEARFSGLTKKVKFLNNVQVEISSSMIRARIKKQAPYQHFLPISVVDYLVENRIYQ